MLAKEIFTKEDEQYIIDIRRTLHRWPEGGFDTPKTLELVCNKLSEAGIEYTDKYGLASIVGYINKDLKGPDGKRAFTIAIRADMDALPVTEKTGLEYCSVREGFMHACGHDAHTAMLLGTGKVLKRLEKQLSCRVKLIFQACEESAFDKRSGAKMMCEDGVLDDVDVVLGQHVDNNVPCGKIGMHPGPACSNSNPITIEFFGKSSHATKPDCGIDALAMAVKFINDYQYVLTRRVSPTEPVASSVCSLHTSSDNFNVTSDYAVIKMTLRTFSDEANDLIEGQIRMLADNAAKEMGGSAKVNACINYPAGFNDDKVFNLLKASQAKVVGEENCVDSGLEMSSEDFAFYSRIKPAAFVRLGTGNTAKGCTQALHANDFCIDEDSFAIGSKAMLQFVFDYQNGI